MLAELQASYTSKLFGLYDEQYKLGYWASYAEGECVSLGRQEESSRSTFESTQNTESPESSTIVEELSSTAVEVQVLPVPTGEGISKVAEAAGAEPVVAILQELPPTLPEPSVPPPLEAFEIINSSISIACRGLF